MQWLNNLKIGQRIGLVVALPVLGLLFYSSTLTLERHNTAQSMERLSSLAKLAPITSALVHELQKERGMSAGFISSGGNTFKNELPGQRDAASAARTALEGALSEFDVANYSVRLEEKIQSALDAIAGLDQTRANVSSLQATVPQMAKYYTGTIAKLLSIVEEMTQLSESASVLNAITAYTAILQGKESAGIERAMGAAGFGAGQFKPAIYKRFTRLAAMQDTYFTVFKNYALDTQVGFFDSTLTGAEVDEVARLRQVADESITTGSTGGVKGAYWFDKITAKIDLMKVVEDKMAGHLTALAAEIEGSASTAFYLFAIVTLALLAATAGIVFFLARGITQPIASMTDVMHRLSGGDNTVEVNGAERRDEIGAIAQAVQVFKDNAIEMERMRAERVEAEEKAKAQRKQEMNELAENFEAAVKGVVESVAASAHQMESTAQSMASSSEQTSQQSVAVAGASEEAAGNIQTVASASEELSSSIKEIGNQVAQSTQIAREAVEQATKTNEEVSGLVEAAKRIGEVVNLIQDIAEQTNLLALNATIEAARAGDAGKGFAVVASEVKSLANQTAKATEEIGSQISGIQSATTEAAGAISHIGETIEKMNEIAGAVAAAVEQQAAATQEISRNVQEASTGAQEVSKNISGVMEAADASGQAAKMVLSAANEVSGQSQTLGNEVDGFLERVREA